MNVYHISIYSEDITGLQFRGGIVEILSVSREVSGRLELLHGVGAGPGLGQSVECDVLHPVEMDEGGRDDENVKYLVGLEPEVTLARQEPLENDSSN